MSFQTIAVLLIFAFMIVGFLLGKWPMGLTTMTCCVMLVLTGVMKIPEAFGGFAMKNTVMIAGMYCVSAAFGKTSLIDKIRQKALTLGAKGDIFVVLLIMGLTIIFSQFLPSSALITIMIMILESQDPDGELCPSRMLLPIAGMAAIWQGALPIGGGAASYLELNQRVKSFSPDALDFQIFDYFKIMIIPLILATAYVIFTYKWLPKRSVDKNKLSKVKEKEPISKAHETIIFITFIVSMCAMFLNSVLGDIIYIIPAVCACVLAYTHSLTQKELQMTLSSDTVFLLAGVFVMSDALSKSGAGEIIGNAVLSAMGSNPSSLMVNGIFGLSGLLMTQFLSNNGTRNVLYPIAIATCVAAGWDPRGPVMAIKALCGCAVLLPSGAPATAIAFASGEYKLQETTPWAFVFALICYISITLSVNFIFPVF